MERAGILASVTAPRCETPPALQRLRPPTPGPPAAVVARTDVPASTWTGLHLDGVLVPLWREVSRLVTVDEGPAVRAQAFAALVPGRAVVGQLAAAWVHAGGTPPHRVTVLVRSGARRPDPHPDRLAAEADLADDDVQSCGGVAVTTVLRTALDVARWVPADRALPALRALVPAGLRPDEALGRLATRAGGRGVRAARRTLAQV